MQATITEELVEERREKTPLGERVIPVPLLLSVCAVLISLAAIIWTIYHDPFRSHLNRYDFSTPKGCLISVLELGANNDIGSSLALQRLLGQRAVEEKLRTIGVHKEAEWRGEKILFVSYEKNGIKKYATEAFSKDAETGFWQPSYVGIFSMGDEDKALSTMMKTWQEKGRFE